MNIKRVTAIAVCLLALVALYLVVQAGDLEPPGPPAPTMVTLQEIYDRVSASPVGLLKTGQTGCWDAFGIAIACAGTGQDGESQAGVSVSPRFADNGDGTVKDNLTGLIWLTESKCFGLRSWTNALSDANGLADPACSLSDGSVAGDWRLPNVRELQSLLDFDQVSPALPSDHPFSGVPSSKYWSSTTHVNVPSIAWGVNLSIGGVVTAGKTDSADLWPVRGGQ